MPKTKAKKPLEKALKEKTKKEPPPWAGPESKESNGGVTQSLLGRFLTCRERFRVYAIEGLRAEEKFSAPLEYGNLWHACEEGYHGGKNWKTFLTKEFERLRDLYPMQQTEVLKWTRVCETQFPIYIDYWKKNDKEKRDFISQEQVFQVPYPLPSGRVVYLRGKFDGVYKRGRRLALFENKTKGEIDELYIERQLNFDIQTMIYLSALSLQEGYTKGMEITYNVIRRPLSGGKGSIKRREATQGSKCNLKACSINPNPSCKKCRGTGRYGAKPEETHTEFYDRLARDYLKAEPEYWFARWTAQVDYSEILDFQRRFLTPILEQLCDWYVWVTKAKDVWSPESQIGIKFKGEIEGVRVRYINSDIHYQTPYGLYNPLARGAMTDVDNYILTGNSVGLSKVSSLFRELEDD